MDTSTSHDQWPQIGCPSCESLARSAGWASVSEFIDSRKPEMAAA